MARLRVVVETESGRKEFPVSPKVEVEFERHWNVGIGRAFQDMRKEHVHHLGWLAAKAAGEVVKPFDGWLEMIVDTEIAVDTQSPSTATA